MLYNTFYDICCRDAFKILWNSTIGKNEISNKLTNTGIFSLHLFQANMAYLVGISAVKI